MEQQKPLYVQRDEIPSELADLLQRRRAKQGWGAEEELSFQAAKWKFARVRSKIVQLETFVDELRAARSSPA